MKQVIDRIQPAGVTQIIKLTESEKDLFNGAGWKLARFEDGELKGFFDPTHSDADPAEDALAWLANAEGEVWLVMCSCYELCQPRQIMLTDALSLAHMARVFNDQDRA